MAVAETRSDTFVAILFGQRVVQFVEDTFNHVLWSNWALMREVEAEVDGGLAYLLLHVSGLPQDICHRLLEVCPDDLWLKISEKYWQRFLY